MLRARRFALWEEHIEAEHFDQAKVYDLDAERQFPLVPDMKLVIHGFPDPINDVDFDAKHLSMQRLSISATAKGQSEFIGVRKLAFDTDAKMPTFSGMSGAPVFAIRPLNDKQSAAMLESMLIRGTPSSRIGFYLRAVIIRNAIDKHIQETAGGSA